MTGVAPGTGSFLRLAPTYWQRNANFSSSSLHRELPLGLLFRRSMPCRDAPGTVISPAHRRLNWAVEEKHRSSVDERTRDGRFIERARHGAPDGGLRRGRDALYVAVLRAPSDGTLPHCMARWPAAEEKAGRSYLPPPARDDPPRLQHAGGRK